MPLAVRWVVVVFAGDGDADQHERIRARRKCIGGPSGFRVGPRLATSPPRRHFDAIRAIRTHATAKYFRRRIPKTDFRLADITVLRPKWSPKFISQFEAPFASRKIFQLDAYVQAAPPRLINKKVSAATPLLAPEENRALSRTLTLFFLFPPPRLSSFFFLQAASTVDVS